MSYKYKVFISHAAKDYPDLVQPFTTLLLKQGLELSEKEIFCSSAGSIPAGSGFVSQISGALAQSEHVVALVSSTYLDRSFCMAEAGAAQMKQVSMPETFFPLRVPPCEHTDLTAVFAGIQVEDIHTTLWVSR